MNLWLLLVIGSLATYRLALMFSKESGPGRIFKKLRHAAPAKSATREGLSCLHCESVWWATPVMLFFGYRQHIAWSDAWLWWLAFSAGAIIIHHAFTEDFKK